MTAEDSNKNSGPPKVDKSKYPIFAILDDVWANSPSTHCDCSLFLKTVAAKIPVYVGSGNANAIIDYLAKSSAWIQLKNDARQAAQFSAAGYFVVGGESKVGHGHVVVVVPGWSPHNCPMGYWGQLGGRGAANFELSATWIGPDRWDKATAMKRHPHAKGTPSPLERVQYFAFPVPSLAPANTRQ